MHNLVKERARKWTFSYALQTRHKRWQPLSILSLAANRSVIRCNEHCTLTAGVAEEHGALLVPVAVCAPGEVCAVGAQEEGDQLVARGHRALASQRVALAEKGIGWDCYHD